MKHIKVSLALNVVIFVMVVFATICMYTGLEFMGPNVILSAESVKMLQFYTVQSNLLMGIMALVFAIYDIMLLRGKISAIPSATYILKLTFTVGVTITLLTVVLYFTPFMGARFWTLYVNSNLFFHLLVPLCAIITFVCFEKTDRIKLKLTPICLIPTILYGLYYAINAFTHVVDGEIPSQYDWYGFAKGGLLISIIVFVFALCIAYLIIWVLWKLNKHKYNMA